MSPGFHALHNKDGSLLGFVIDGYQMKVDRSMPAEPTKKPKKRPTCPWPRPLPLTTPTDHSMPTTSISLDTAALLKILTDDINEMTRPMARHTGCTQIEVLLGQIDGVQISLKVSRDEDEFMDDDINKHVITKAKKPPAKAKSAKKGQYEAAAPRPGPKAAGLGKAKGKS